MAPDIGQWEGQDVPLVRPSSCNVKGGIPSSRRYPPTYLDYSQAEAKKSPPTATPWAKQLQTVLDKAKEENKDLKGWFVIPAWGAQVVAATFRMLGSTSALFPLLPSFLSLHF